jgi:Holliday junction resolvase
MSIYSKGRRKEYYIIELLKKEGYDIVQRTAGSHSIMDIVGIDTVNKRIKIIQSKRTINQDMNYINPEMKEKIEKKLNYLKGFYTVDFEVM